MPVDLKCIECGSSFRVPPSLVGKRKYCSRECGSKSGSDHPSWMEGPREKQCQHCGKLFQKLPRRAMSIFLKQKFCSKLCADEGGFRYFGEANPKWNGNPRRKHPGAHAAWARKVLSRDKATCQVCGVTGVELHAHHIKSYKEHPELRWDVSNGLTVCHSCHWDIHAGVAANGVNSGEPAAGGAGGNPEPSFGRKPVEGVTTRGRAYRRWEGSCDHCGTFLSKRWSDVKGKTYITCSRSCARSHYWVQWRAAHGSNSSTSALPETDDIVWTHGRL